MLICTVANLILTQPIWLIGLWALLGPVLLHLWSRRVGAPAWFPSIRLIKEIDHTKNRRSRLHDVLLLVLRCFLLILLVLIFCQPTWSATKSDKLNIKPAHFASGQRVTIIMDRSASMSRTVHGASLFDQAKLQTIELIRSLESHDQVMVVIADHQPWRLFTDFTSNFDALIPRLNQLQAGHTHANLNEALSLSPRNNPVHIFWDGQASALPQLPNRSIHWHTIGQSLPDNNLALSQPHLTPAYLIAGQPTTLTVKVTNYSNNRIQSHIQWQLGKGQWHTRPLFLNANDSATVNLPIIFDRAGVHTITAKLPSDSLTLDNHITLIASVSDGVSAMYVTQDDPDDVHTLAYYLSRAIQPGTNWPYHLQVTKPGQPISGKPAIMVLDDPTRVPIHSITNTITLPSFATLNHLRQSSRNAITWQGLSFLISPSPATMHIDPSSNDALFGLFEGEARQTLADLTFNHYFKTSDPDHTLTIVAQSTQGQPLLVSRTINGQRHILLTASISPESATVKSAAFMPLIHRLLSLAMPDAPPLNITQPGRSAVIPIDLSLGNQSLHCLSPDDTKTDLLIQRINNAAHATVHLNTLKQVGLYQFFNDHNQLVAGVTSLINPAESNLQRIAKQKLNVVNIDKEPVIHSVLDREYEPLSPSEQPILLWPFLALLFFGLLVIESLLGNWLAAIRLAALTVSKEPHA